MRVQERTSGGFTLLELIVVLALLAVVAGVTTSNLAGFVRGRAADEECRRLVALLEYARSSAISRSARTTVWVELANGEYGITDEGTGGPNTTHQIADRLQLGATDADNQPAEGRIEILVWPDGEYDARNPLEIAILEGDVATWRVRWNATRFRYEATTEETDAN
ncbi:MAG: GspH/FimT family pseudopilin [Candidatus Sumerlaeia bacterium]|nr:GspH/FimT family pseudopilin [Candidatus Sumerlaeia bacterium]